jgi:hypothetical protein
LTNFTVFVVDSDLSVFSVIVSLDGHDLSFLVDQHVTFPSEELEPSGIGGSRVQVGRSSIALNGDRSTFPLVILNGLSLIIKEELLSFVGFSQGLESQIMSTNAFDNSVHPQLGYDEERSLDLKPNFLVQSLALDLCSIFRVNKFP